MLDLCNKDKYYSDAGLSSETDRLPRSVEDIEIIGVVYSDETINFPSLSSQCGIKEIASLTINFYNNSTGTLIVEGSASENSNNLRKPVEPELSRIQENDPLRYNHGWYTIDPNYSIGCIITNGNVEAKNIGFNNKRTDCYNFKLNNSILADTVLSVNKIEFSGTSRAYNSQLICNEFISGPNIKMDNMVIQTLSGQAYYSGGSYLTCQMIHPSLNIISSILIDCSINNVSTGFFENLQLYRSVVISDASGDIKTSGISIDKSNLVIDRLDLNTGTTIDSSMDINKLSTSMRMHTFTNSNIKAYIIDNCYINNHGVLIFNNVYKLKLENNAQAQITRLYANQGTIINNNSGAFLNIQSGYLYNGVNNATIGGTIVEYGGLFSNSSSGLIIANLCNIYGTGTNDGTISTCDLYDDAINKCSNNNSIKNASFYHRSKNSGIIDVGSFYDVSRNVSTGILKQATFYSGSINQADINNGITSLIFRDTSKNSGNIALGTFYSGSINYSNCSGCKFFDKSLFQGARNRFSSPIPNATSVEFFQQSKVTGAINVEQCNFKDQSSFDTIIINNSKSTNLYGSTKGDIVSFEYPESGSFIMHDKTIVENIYGGAASGTQIHAKDFTEVKYSSGEFAISFFDRSKCGDSAALSGVNLYDASSAKGSSYVSINTYDKSAVPNFQNIKYLIASGNSQLSGQKIQNGILAGNSQTTTNIVETGLVIGNAKLFSRSPYIISQQLKFYDSASNYITIYTPDDNIVEFRQNSLNTATGIIDSSGILFQDGSKNFGSVYGDKTIFRDNSNNYKAISGTSYYDFFSNNYAKSGLKAYFGTGCVNYGELDTGYFYAGSRNLGIVKTGIFDNLVLETGTVLMEGSRTNLGPYGPSF